VNATPPSPNDLISLTADDDDHSAAALAEASTSTLFEPLPHCLQAGDPDVPQSDLTCFTQSTTVLAFPSTDDILDRCSQSRTILPALDEIRSIRTQFTRNVQMPITSSEFPDSSSDQGGTLHTRSLPTSSVVGETKLGSQDSRLSSQPSLVPCLPHQEFVMAIDEPGDCDEPVVKDKSRSPEDYPQDPESNTPTQLLDLGIQNTFTISESSVQVSY
jgi:hypothetical protein